MLARIRKAQEENEGGFTLIELLVVIIIIGIRNYSAGFGAVPLEGEGRR